MGCLNLLSNVLVYYNTLAMQAVVDRLKAQRYLLNPAHLASIWPTRFKHINVYGTYQFDREGKVPCFSGYSRVAGAAGA